MSTLEQTPKYDDVLLLIRAEDWAAVTAAFADMHVADIADVIANADAELRESIFKLVGDDLQPDVLAELQEHEQADELLESLSDQALSDLAEEMSPDDAADVIAELDEERSESVLQLMEEEEARELRILLAYEPESAGGIMTTEVVALHQALTVGEALQELAKLDVDEPYHNLFTVDRNQVLTGMIGLWELIRLRPESKLSEVKHPDVVSVRSNLDQEEVASVMRKYDLTSIPVVQANGRLIGRITSDDVMDVMEEEATEDMLRIAGTNEQDLLELSPWVSLRSRLPWLMITLLGGCLTSILMDSFHQHLASVMVLSLFIPMVMAIGGNTGIQTSIIFVRGLALGTVTPKTIGRMLWRELLSGMMMGSVCGLLMAVWVPFIINITGAQVPFGPSYVGIVAGFSLFVAMTMASVFGGLFPLLFQRLRIDPAVASGPLITASIDILALLVYFGVSYAMVSTLLGSLP